MLPTITFRTMSLTPVIIADSSTSGYFFSLEATSCWLVLACFDTMVETAKKLSELKNKAVILVGASKPEKFKDSDAQFNIGVAIGGINVLDSGIYIAMNGRIFQWDNVRKNKLTGEFETIN